MKCAHCNGEIRHDVYEHTWIALLPLPGESPEDVPHFHRKRKRCREAGYREASFRGALDQQAVT